MVKIMSKDEQEKFYQNKKVLVTGHTGFIGSWLSECLVLLNSKVSGYALDPPTIPNLFESLNLTDLIEDNRGDVRNSKLLRKTIREFEPEIVFHLAAQPIVLNSYESPVETFDINVTGTVNLLNELRNIDSVRTIIVMTSDKSYRNNEWVYPYRESDVLSGKDPYSASKSCQDIVVNSFRESYFSNSGVGISSIRAGNVIGGGDWAPFRIVPDLDRGISTGKTVKIRNPDSVRPWQHVLEPISGILKLGEEMYKNMKFSSDWNFGPEINREITVKELADTFIGYWGSGNYSIDGKQRNEEANYLQLDINKAKRELKWMPRYDFKTAVKQSVEWYKSFYTDRSNVRKKTEEQINKYFSTSML